MQHTRPHRKNSVLPWILLAILTPLAFVAGGVAVWWLTPTAEAPTAAEAKPEIWTCSMHPQIRQPNPGTCPICAMDLVPVKTEQTAGLRELRVTEAGAALMDIVTSPVERKFVTASIRMVGKVDYDETRLSDITAWVPGRLDRLFVDYTGITVAKGEHMVKLYSPQLLTAQEELLQAIAAAAALADSDVGIMRETTEATVTASREKLRLLGLSPKLIARIEKSGKTTDIVQINAPVGGIVIRKHAREGMYVKTGTRIYTIADLTNVWVKLDAYESDLTWLHYGQKVRFTTEAYPGEQFAGTISFIDPVLTASTRTIKVRVSVPNSDGRLKPGMFVRAVVLSKVAEAGKVVAPEMAGKWICTMHREIIKDAPGKCDLCGMPLKPVEEAGFVTVAAKVEDAPLVVPAGAVLITGRRAVVYVKTPDAEKPTFEGREILLGPRVGRYYIVRNGLREGEHVVTRGNFKIDSALQIQARPSMMSPEGGAADVPIEKEVPRHVRMQLKRLLEAGRTVADAIDDGDPAKIHAAFGKVKARLDEIKADGLTGRAGAVWKELAMLLDNDAVEGLRYAKTPADARRAARSLRHHLGRVAKVFRLLPHGSVASRPAGGHVHE